MALIWLEGGASRDVPDDAVITERGVEFLDGETKHIIPWHVIYEYEFPYEPAHAASV